ncbi:MAG: hypothetical protein ACJASQ_000895 [Crocinitomicaceae bacterium]|jgi:hypothetical protein
MNIKTKISFGIAVLIGTSILSLSSCKKDEVVPAPNPIVEPETFGSIYSYLDSEPVAVQEFEMIAENGASFTASKGSSITIPANAFITYNGLPVTGNVTITVKEIFSQKDMLFTNILPVSYGEPLNSGGEFFLLAAQNGASLRVADGVFIDLKIPAQAIDNNMQLFMAGQNVNADSVFWGLADTTSGFTFNSPNNEYELNLDSLGWGNIDAFLSNVTYFDIPFNLTGVSGLDNSNTKAFAVFENQNSVWPIAPYTGIDNNVIDSYHLADVPMNVVVISVVNGQLYYGLLNVTPQQGLSYDIPMNETTSNYLDQIISNLP